MEVLRLSTYNLVRLACIIHEFEKVWLVFTVNTKPEKLTYRYQFQWVEGWVLPWSEQPRKKGQ